MIKKLLLVFTLLIAPLVIFAQEEEEDNTKMVREVVTVQVDKSKFAPPPPPPTAETNSKKKKKQHHSDPPPEVAPDTGNPMMPAPISEITKRADNWTKAKSLKYKKENVSNTGSTIQCMAVFPFKQKQLNPENEVDGDITMDVIVEAKEGKFRYTIKNIKHKAAKQGKSGGDIYLQVPECGSMNINDQTWKHIKSAAFADIQIVVDDLKAKMKEDGDKPKKDEW